MVKKIKFVDNKNFLKLLKEYKYSKNVNSVKYDLIQNREVYNKLGLIFIKMGKQLLFSPKFINYTGDWKDEMLSEAMYNCCRYISTYDVKRNNPFAYFTAVIWNSFLQVLNKEHKIKNRREDMREKVWNETFLNEKEYSEHVKRVDLEGLDE